MNRSIRAALSSFIETLRVAQGRLPDSLSIVDTPDFIAMDAAPREALRRMPRASVKVAAEMVSRGEADGFYSLGHTGATVLAAHAAFGVLEGAERPAIAASCESVEACKASQSRTAKAL